MEYLICIAALCIAAFVLLLSALRLHARTGADIDDRALGAACLDHNDETLVTTPLRWQPK